MLNTSTRLRFLWLLPVLSLFMLCACSKDDPKPEPTPEPEPTPQPLPEKHRTVLFYMMDDHNLWDYMEKTINQLEAGWDEQTDGNLLVYLDPSPRLTQFPNPVLLKIVHDETNAIRSEVVIEYPEQDPVDHAVMKGVLEEVIELFPAQSHGLIIGTHGMAWFPDNLGSLIPGTGHDDEEDIPNPEGMQSRSLGGGERFGTALEINDLAELLPIKYDFLMFHACLMGNIETAYELRDKCNVMLGCMKPLPGYAFPYDEITPYLFTKPQADFYHVVRSSIEWYDALSNEEFMQVDISVIRTDKLDALAAATKTILTKLAADPEELHAMLEDYNRYIDEDVPLSDLRIIINRLCVLNPELAPDYLVFEKALKAAVLQQASTAREEDPALLPSNLFCGLSCYVPLLESRFAALNDLFETDYAWSNASGFGVFVQP